MNKNENNYTSDELKFATFSKTILQKKKEGGEKTVQKVAEFIKIK